MSRPEVDPKRTGLKAVPTVFECKDGYFPDYAEPGSFELRLGEKGSYVMLACPGCGRVSGMTVGNPKPAEAPSWELTGTPAAPTLHPSINCVGCCRWHGWLKDGVYKSC
jgi:hypothetical protein